MAHPASENRRDTKPSKSSLLSSNVALLLLGPILAISLSFLWPASSFASLLGTDLASKASNFSVGLSRLRGAKHDPHPTTNEALRARYSLSCPSRLYGTHLFSSSPLIIYLTDFITPDERAYLLSTAASNFERSLTAVEIDGEVISLISDYRTSFSAFIDDDPVADCIRRRTATLQGHISPARVETLQAVKYAVGQQYHGHYDWEGTQANPRVSSIFAYLACDGSSLSEDSQAGSPNVSPEGSSGFMDSSSQEPSSFSSSPAAAAFPPTAAKPSSSSSTLCTGGSTHFPAFEGSFSDTWCDTAIDCSETTLAEGGVAFKPVVGNAVFWSNVYPNGSFHEDTWHMGLPVEEGVKVGLNIWTRERELERVREEEGGKRRVVEL